MTPFQENILTKLGLEIGPPSRGEPRLTFEARVWRLVMDRVPGLGADETCRLSSQIVRASITAAGHPTARTGRRRPRQSD